MNSKYKFWFKISNIFLITTLTLLTLGIGIHILPDILNQNGSSIYVYVASPTLRVVNILIDAILASSALIAIFAAIRADSLNVNGLLEDLRLSRTRE